MPASPIDTPLESRAPAAPPAPLYRAGALAACTVVALLVLQSILFMLWPPPAFEPTPANTRDWFALLAAHPWRGLVHLDALMLVDFVLVVVMFTAVWGALRRVRPAASLVALILLALSSAVYLASNPAFTMLSLARLHAASPASDHALYIAAGQTALAVYHGTPFDVGYVLSAIAGLLMCSAMLRTHVFGAPTAYLGLVMYTMNLVPPTAGTLGMVLSVSSLPLLAVWLVLVARRLFKLARS